MAEKNEVSKELKKVIDAIHGYVEKNDGDVQFVFSIMKFDDDSKILEDRIGVYGEKQAVLICLRDLLKQVKGEKEEFINW